MRINTIGIGRHERISDTLPSQIIAPAIEAEDGLTLQHKMVLLKLRDTETSRAILDKLCAMGAPEPSASDRQSMIEATYVRVAFERSFAGSYTLTPPGSSKTNEIMHELCRRYSIHSFTTSGGRTVRRGTIVRCSCAWSAGPFHNDRFGESRMRTAMVAHEKSNSGPGRTSPALLAPDHGAALADVPGAAPLISERRTRTP